MAAVGDRPELGEVHLRAGPQSQGTGPLSSRVELSLPARAALAVGVTVILAVTAVHLVATFFYLAPSNTVSDRYQGAINTWMEPYFRQGWSFFAPNPHTANLRVMARMSTSPGPPTHPSDWFDISSYYYSHSILHDPFPDHQAQNALTRAWEEYLKVATATPVTAAAGVQLVEPDRSRRGMIEQYFDNVALDVLKHRTHTRITAVQVLVSVSPISVSKASPGGQASEGGATISFPWKTLEP